jgi:hypothetical protein
LGAAGLGLGNVAYATGGSETTVDNSYSPTEIQQAIYSYDVVKFAPGEYYLGEGTLGELNVVNSTKLVALYPENKPVLKAYFNVDAPGDAVAFENLSILSTRPPNWPPTDPDGLGVIHNQGSADLKVLNVDIEAGEFNVHGVFCRELNPDDPQITGNILIEGCSIVCGPRWTVAIKNEELHDVNLFVKNNYVQAVFGIDNVPDGPPNPEFPTYNGVMNIENNDIEVVGNYYGLFSFGIWIAGTTAESNTTIKSNNINIEPPSSNSMPYGVFRVGVVLGTRSSVQNVVVRNNTITGEAGLGFMLGGFFPFGLPDIFDCVLVGNNISNLSIVTLGWYDNNNPAQWRIYGSTYYLSPQSHDIVILGNNDIVDDDGINNWITGADPTNYGPITAPPGDLVAIAQAAKYCVENDGQWDQETMTCQQI